jgi:rhomboid family GlyGly-CTERM serine protease
VARGREYPPDPVAAIASQNIPMNKNALQTEIPRRPMRIAPGLILPIVAVVASIVIQCSPAAQALLQYDRNAIGIGQHWRLVTGHMVHWGWKHLAGDISALVLLCWMISPRGGWKNILAALGGAVAISLAIMIVDPSTVIYRGMSGVNYGLLAWVVLTRLAASPGRTAACYAALLAALAAKVSLDLAAPGLIPSIGLPEGITLTGTAHFAGFYAFALIWAFHRLRLSSLSELWTIAVSRCSSTTFKGDKVWTE